MNAKNQWWVLLGLYTIPCKMTFFSSLHFPGPLLLRGAVLRCIQARTWCYIESYQLSLGDVVDLSYVFCLLTGTRVLLLSFSVAEIVSYIDSSTCLSSLRQFMEWLIHWPSPMQAEWVRTTVRIALYALPVITPEYVPCLPRPKPA